MQLGIAVSHVGKGGAWNNEERHPTSSPITATQIKPSKLGPQKNREIRSDQGGSHSQISDTVKSPQSGSTTPKCGVGGACAPDPTQISIFAHVLDMIHRRRLDGPGRVWLLLRSIDTPGEGRLPLNEIRFRLAHPESDTKCLSPKRLQQIIRQGEGLFWHRCKHKRLLYLHSEARLARDLGLKRIGGWAVQISPKALLQPIRMVRALFYDAFHSGRGDGVNDPITRRVLRERGGAEAQTQRKYEQMRGIDSQANYATLGLYTKAAWQRAKYETEGDRVGGPAFIYIDYKGVLGKNSARIRRKKQFQHWHNIYIARRIGNAYHGTLATVKRSRRWTNRKLKYLCHSMSTTSLEPLADALAVSAASFMGSFEPTRLDRPGERFYYQSQEVCDRLLSRNHEEEKVIYRAHQLAEGNDGTDQSFSSGYWIECFTQVIDYDSS